MFDRYLRPLIDPPLNRAGLVLARAGVGADALTLAGLVCGVLAAVAVVLHWTWVCLALIAASRLADGLDGAVARARGAHGTDFGGYFDIVADFVFYAAVPIGFVLADPATNGAAGAFLLATFYVNGASFLGFAVIAEKRRLTSLANGRKAFFHSVGLLEGSETIAFFVLLCLMPGAFAPLAWAFGALVLLSAALRLAAARRAFRD